MTTNEEENADISYTYRFDFTDGTSKSHEVRIDPKSFEVRTDPSVKPPSWTRLSHHQCAGCPLKESETPDCPVAVNLIPIVDLFKDDSSTRSAEMTVGSNRRTVTRKGTLMEGLASLIGLLMAGSSCPVLGKLRPLVRTHLPFAVLDESAYRILGLYLLAQYFIGEAGGKPDSGLTGLARFGEEIQDVNRAFLERIIPLCKNDSVLNSITKLDCATSLAGMSPKGKRLREIRKNYSDYLPKSR